MLARARDHDGARTVSLLQAIAEDLRPTATATVAEVLGHIYGRRFYWKFS